MLPVVTEVVEIEEALIGQGSARFGLGALAERGAAAIALGVELEHGGMVDKAVEASNGPGHIEVSARASACSRATSSACASISASRPSQRSAWRLRALAQLCAGAPAELITISVAMWLPTFLSGRI